ncbi:Hypothetical protein PHPALM_9651, partial [Phytophthora palmivora]
MRGGDVGDRWALDVAGPFPISNGAYVTRYAVARCVHEHTAKSVATFLMEDIVLKFGAFVATFMTDEKQNDWNLWVKFAVYAYNSAKHSTVALSPNELMVGRRLRPPNELLRRLEVTEAGELQTYHEQLIAAMTRSFQCAEEARQREQSRQARYYNRKVRQRREFHIGDRVWLYNPPRGRTATKFVHQWMGPMKIVEPAGYENYVLQREDKSGSPETVIAHVSFLVSYYYPEPLLKQVAADIDEQLRDEDQVWHERNVEATAASVRTTTTSESRRTATTMVKRAHGTIARKNYQHDTSGKLVELRRRRKRNRAG